MPAPNESFCEDVKEDVFLGKDEKTNEVVGIGILNFKAHVNDLRNILASIPVRVNFESVSC